MTINETKIVVFQIEHNGHQFDCEHTLNYYDDDTLAIGEFDYDTEPYPTNVSFEDADTISEGISEYLLLRCCRGLSDITDGETISIAI